MTKLTKLSQPELDVMLQLAQSRTTTVVLLAADLWRTTPDWKAWDPYPLIGWTLDSLSERGLVTYRIHEDHRRTHGLPFDIRLTPKGWELMGYGNKTVEVGTPSRHDRQPLHPGDMTDYLNLHHTAVGGPIETDTFAEHRVFFPNHAHMYGVPLTMANTATQSKRSRTQALASPSIMQDPDGTGDMRQYLRVTPEMQARVLSAREGMGAVSYADIAEETGIPKRTVQYILTDLPRLRRAKAGEVKANASLKERVYQVVEAIGPTNVAEIRRVVGMADTEHDVMHVLHSLHTQGRIDFDERGNGMGTATLVNIRLPKKATKKLDPAVLETLPEIVRDRLPERIVEAGEADAAAARDLNATLLAAGPEATTDEAPKPTNLPSAPEPDDEAYPLLDALLTRERERLDSDTKGMAYVTAAEAIEAIDPDAARALMEKANAFNIPFPSPTEREYLRYVASHPERSTT